VKESHREVSKRKTKKRITEEARIGTRCESDGRAGDLSTQGGVEQMGGRKEEEKGKEVVKRSLSVRER